MTGMGRNGGDGRSQPYHRSDVRQRRVRRGWPSGGAFLTMAGQTPSPSFISDGETKWAEVTTLMPQTSNAEALKQMKCVGR